VRNGSQLLQEVWEKSFLEQMSPEDCVGWRGEVKAQPSDKMSKHSNIMNQFTQPVFRAAINEG